MKQALTAVLEGNKVYFQVMVGEQFFWSPAVEDAKAFNEIKAATFMRDFVPHLETAILTDFSLEPLPDTHVQKPYTVITK